MKEYEVDKDILDECLNMSEYDDILRKLWKKYDNYYVFSRIVDLRKSDIDHSVLVAEIVNKAGNRALLVKDIKVREIKLAIILLMNEISKKYTDRMKNSTVSLASEFVTDDILVPFTVVDFSEDSIDEIHFQIYTVRRLSIRNEK